jgi:peptidoglycan/xylan/chitin deacetylase (PgdA/CDA1 family)
MKSACARIPIFIYHRVGADGDIDRFSHLLAIEESKFAAQMRCLVDRGFETLTVADFLAVRNGSAGVPERAVIISFDDGYENTYMRALPILRRYGLTATFFIVTGLVGTKDYLNWDQLSEMKAAGMNIESHTHTHPVLTELPREKIREELRMSKEILEGKLGSKITVLCVPGGFTNAVVSKMAQDLGYKALCTSLPGLNRIDDTGFELDRISIRGFDPMSKFEAFLCGRQSRIYRYRLRQVALAGIKGIVGRGNYERVKGFILSR